MYKKRVSVVDADGNEYAWNMPVSVAEIVERIQTNWTEPSEPPSDFVVTKTRIDGTAFPRYHVTYKKGPMTLRSLARWVRWKLAMWIMPARRGD